MVFMEKIYEPEQFIEVMLHRFQMNMEKARKTYSFLTCSIGVFITDKSRSLEECYEMADQALYETQNGNKDIIR